jgi:hypothetical protein
MESNVGRLMTIGGTSDFCGGQQGTICRQIFQTAIRAMVGQASAGLV